MPRSPMAIPRRIGTSSAITAALRARSSKANSKQSKGGTTVSRKTESVNVLVLLGVAFVVLKLCHVISWSWWWVTVPFWGGAALMLAILVIVGILSLVFAILT